MKLTDINELRELLSRHGFRFSKSLGQNFLVAAWVPADIAQGAELDRDTGVLEVGPGVGCLTAELSRQAGKVLCVELDKSLKGVLAETLSDCGNVEIVFADVLKLDLAQLVKEHLSPLRPVVCANIPYNVTTPLITKFLEADCFDTITVMIQREVARRICAAPGTADYGAFTLMVQWYASAETLFEVPSSCFMPQPKVDSAVITLKRRSEPPVAVKDEKLMFRVIRASFNQRRKTLLNALSSAFGELDRGQIEGILSKCGFDTKIRGETLDIGGFAKIADEIGKITSVDL